MRIFVLQVGKVGSVTFARACQPIENFSVGHELRMKQPLDRLAYPDQHIEVDCHLLWFAGEIEEKYGANARYVFLTRDEEAIAMSFREKWGKGVMKGWYEGVLMQSPSGTPDHETCLSICRSYVRAGNALIRAFLRGIPAERQLSLRLHEEHGHSRNIMTFWDWIGAKGNLEDAVALAKRRHNETKSLASRRELWRWREPSI
jgi:hypothetical protein